MFLPQKYLPLSYLSTSVFPSFFLICIMANFKHPTTEYESHNMALQRTGWVTMLLEGVLLECISQRWGVASVAPLFSRSGSHGYSSTELCRFIVSMALSMVQSFAQHINSVWKFLWELMLLTLWCLFDISYWVARRWLSKWLLLLEQQCRASPIHAGQLLNPCVWELLHHKYSWTRALGGLFSLPDLQGHKPTPLVETSSRKFC